MTINDLIELKKMLPNNNLCGIRNKNTNKLIAVCILDNWKILYSVDCNIMHAFIKDNKDIEKVYEILSQDEDFKNNNFIDVLTDRDKRIFGELNYDMLYYSKNSYY